MSNSKKVFTHQEVCNILCEGCQLKIPLNTHIFNDKSYQLYHVIMDKNLTCDAAEWRKKSKMPVKLRRKTDIKDKYPREGMA